ncbi:hypothetical protein [Pukyongiella litopenaei]|uniref:Uncharacterized protein n=1 Tax=Pukyongiella litopenaei TaxID=2605946 RepID=A0A2S0MN17_9RHOB|nr:hypothetical protein [Pukyongiella litopenaei]AVO37207.1 hypothetical protein C6Y53_05450 [Pukyongiella litopenaei]
MLAALVAVVVPAGCSTFKRDEGRIAFDGVYFRSKTAAVDKKVTLADFTTTVKGVSASFDGAREAGRYEGTRYCISNYGTSKIDWSVGPDTDPQRLTIVDDTLTFSGRCRS